MADPAERSPTSQSGPTAYPTSTTKPDFLPGLYSSLEEAQRFGKKHLNTNGDSGENPTQAPKYSPNTPVDNLLASTKAKATSAAHEASEAQPLATTETTGPTAILPNQITWANVAALPKTTIKQPVTTIVLANKKMKKPVLPNNPASTHGARPNPTEPSSMQKRVVFIRNCGERITVRKITASIKEGPLMSIVLENSDDFPPQVACIIFYAAKDALEFKEKIDRLEREEGRTLYGPKANVILGPLWPEDDDIRSMHWVEGGKERRRLTFSGPGTFDRVSRSEFVKDNEDAVGPRNIELVWLFNKGNATVIYTSVQVARTARQVFLEKAEKNGPYQSVKVDFSLDPCRKAFKLVTQMRVPRPEVLPYLDGDSLSFFSSGICPQA